MISCFSSLCASRNARWTTQCIAIKRLPAERLCGLGLPAGDGASINNQGSPLASGYPVQPARADRDARCMVQAASQLAPAWALPMRAPYLRNESIRP